MCQNGGAFSLGQTSEVGATIYLELRIGTCGGILWLIGPCLVIVVDFAFDFRSVEEKQRRHVQLTVQRRVDKGPEINRRLRWHTSPMTNIEWGQINRFNVSICLLEALLG